jgi:hypothetical protein
MSQNLQQIFVSEAGEAAYVREIAAMIRAEQFPQAEAKLLGDLSRLSSTLSDVCAASPAALVTISGWDEVFAGVEHYEGDPITAIGVDMWNEDEIVLTKQDAYEPGLTVSFYSDASFPFSTSSRDEIIAENSSEFTSWQGQGEDIEAYIEIDGIADLNCALLNHKSRIFYRQPQSELESDVEDAPPPPTAAPTEYVAFVLASWLRVLRFHQAIRAQLNGQGLPSTIPVILGTHNIKPYLGSALYPQKVIQVARAEVAELSIKIKRTEQLEPELSTGSLLRKRMLEPAVTEPLVAASFDVPEIVEVAEAPRGFFARLFRRR